MFDFLIKSRRLVLDDGTREGEIGIQDGVIAAVLPPGSQAQSRAHLNVGDRLVFPGLIDAHVHFREPGMAYKEGFCNGTRAAAAGGVTTVLVMPTDRPITFTPEEFLAKREMAEGKSCVDFGLSAAVGLDSSNIPILAGLGATSFEIFLADANPALRAELGSTLLTALEAIHKTGGTAGITPGDHAIVEERRKCLRQSGAKAPRDFPRANPPVAEAMGLARGGAAALAVGSSTVFRQTSCRFSVEILRGLKQIGGCLHGEVNPHYLFLTEDALDQFGPFAVMSPPLRSRVDVSALWAGLADGTIDLISTDHAPHLPAEKEQGITDIWETPLGVPGLQTMFPLMLQAVKDGFCSYANIASWCAAAPAKLFGLFPRKGSIARGADADLVIVDPSRLERIEDRHQYSRAARTPFAGREGGGSIDLVFLRGEVICRDGVIIGPPQGRFVHRS